MNSNKSKPLGLKYDDNKERYDLLPFEAIHEVTKVLTYGASKYQDENWRYVDNFKKRYEAAAFRHLTAYMRGEEADPETGFSHLAHATCCLLFLIEGPRDEKSTKQKK